MNLKLNLRTQVQLFKGSDQWEAAVVQKVFRAPETAPAHLRHVGQTLVQNLNPTL